MGEKKTTDNKPGKVTLSFDHFTDSNSVGGHLPPSGMVKLASSIGFDLRFDANGDIVIPVVPPGLDPDVPRACYDPVAQEEALNAEYGTNDIFLEASRDQRKEEDFDPTQKRKRA